MKKLLRSMLPMVAALSLFGVVTPSPAQAHTDVGITNTGHQFSFVLNGEAMVMTGQVVGDFDLTVDPFSSGSCINNTATRFLLTGAVALVH